MFKEGQLADFPEKHVELTVNDEGQIYLAGLLKDLGLSASAGQARRDIDGGGVKIDPQPGRDRQGLRQARAGDALRRDQRA